MGKREGEREPSFFACHEGCLNAWEDGRREVYKIYARGIFSSYRDFCTLLTHVIGASKFQYESALRDEQTTNPTGSVIQAES